MAARRVPPALLVAALAVASCSSDGDASADGRGSPPVADSPGNDGDLFTESGSSPDIDSVVTFEPVPETGVPGIESADEFCRSWSEYAGSVQALTFAWAVQPDDAAALEVAASMALSDAIAGMEANLPAEIEANRQALTVDVPGPLLRRADRARALMVDAGADDAAIAALGDAWIAAITEAGIDSETLAIVVPDGSGEALDSAAARFAAEVPSMVEDPTLDTTRFDIAPSLAYISGACPDQGTLSGNDNVSSQDAG